MVEKMVPVTAELPESLYNSLIELAKQRGVSANTVLQQAVASEKFLADKEAEGGKVIVEGSDKTFKRVVRR